MREEFIVPPTYRGRCCLCWEVFKLGDRYKSVWPKRGGGIKLGLSMHLGCFAQLAPGDLTSIFAALEQRLWLPLAVLNGRRVALRAANESEGRS